MKQPEPLRSTGITPLQGYYGLLRLLPWPAPTSALALYGPVAPTSRTATGLPSCARPLSRRAVPTTPPRPRRRTRLLLGGRMTAFARYANARPWESHYEARYGFTDVTARQFATEAEPRLNLRNLNAPVARARPRRRYSPNRQLTREAPFILRVSEHLRSAYAHLEFATRTKKKHTTEARRHGEKHEEPFGGWTISSFANGNRLGKTLENETISLFFKRVRECSFLLRDSSVSPCLCGESFTF